MPCARPSNSDQIQLAAEYASNGRESSYLDVIQRRRSAVTVWARLVTQPYGGSAASQRAAWAGRGRATRRCQSCPEDMWTAISRINNSPAAAPAPPSGSLQPPAANVGLHSGDIAAARRVCRAPLWRAENVISALCCAAVGTGSQTGVLLSPTDL